MSVDKRYLVTIPRRKGVGDMQGILLCICRDLQLSETGRQATTKAVKVNYDGTSSNGPNVMEMVRAAISSHTYLEQMHVNEWAIVRATRLNT